MRHATENAAKDLLAIQDFEVRLQVDVRWHKELEEWKATSALLVRRRYQRCLDELKGLIVSRMFELTKMNMSQTGSHINIICFGTCINQSTTQATNYESTLPKP
jgi:hypothetical protein